MSKAKMTANIPLLALAVAGLLMAATPSLAAFSPALAPAAGGHLTLTATTTSATVTLPPDSATVCVRNTGVTNDAFVAFVPTSITATDTTNGIPIAPGWEECFGSSNNNFLAAITSTSTTTIDIHAGAGVPALAAAGSAGSSSGSVSNAADAVATSSTNVGSVAYLYGFNGATWDRLRVNANKDLIVGGGGTAGTASASVVTVQGVASMTPLQIGGNTPTSVASASNALSATLFTTATGAVALNFATTNNDTIATSGTGSVLVTNSIMRGFDGSNFIRLKTITGAVAAGTGTLAVEEAGRSFLNITTATTTTVKSGAGFFHTLVVNNPVASATVTIYDNTAASGTKVGTITLPSTITSEAPISLTYDLAFGTGLTVVTSGATDLTVTYR